jgi:Cytochrome c7 and related cytochrome c
MPAGFSSVLRRSVALLAREMPGEKAAPSSSSIDLINLLNVPVLRFLCSFTLLVACLLSLSPLLSIQTQTPQRTNRFSHRQHLALKGISCEDCHYSAISSRLAADDNLPKPETCLACHDGLHAMKNDEGEKAYVFKSPTRTLKFSHQEHLALGNVAPALAAAIDSGTYLSPTRPAREQLETENACTACHRGLAENDATGPANHPQMADCLVCHSTIDAPFSCELCHTADAKIKPASHTPNFIDLHSSRNAKLNKPSCKICHGVGFRCMGCH